MTTMDCEKTLQALRRMKVETGSLVCFACGHEHDCGIRGCAILRNAVEHMEMLLAHYDHLNKLLDDREEELRRFQGTFEDGMRMTNAQKEAYEWAKTHPEYRSVAARYARELAGLVDDLLGKERYRQKYDRVQEESTCEK